MNTDQTLVEICAILDLLERRLSKVEDGLAALAANTKLDGIRREQVDERRTGALARGMCQIYELVDKVNELGEGVRGSAGSEVAAQVSDELGNIFRRRDPE